MNWFNTEIISTLIISIGSFVCFLLVKFVWNPIITKIAKTKFMKNLQLLIKDYVIKAENLFKMEKSGIEKKEYVVSLVKAQAEKIGLGKIWNSLEPNVSAIIDNICSEFNNWLNDNQEEITI